MQSRIDGHITILSPSGRLDQSTVAEFQGAVIAIIEGSSPNLVLDMSQVAFVSSVGLRALVMFNSQAKKDGRKFALAALNQAVKEVLAIARLNTVIPSFAAVDDAVSAQRA